LSGAYTPSPAEPKLFSEFCSYEEILQNLKLSQAENDRVRKHIVTLMREHNKKSGIIS
jgi:hypothetical protein